MISPKKTVFDVTWMRNQDGCQCKPTMCKFQNKDFLWHYFDIRKEKGDETKFVTYTCIYLSIELHLLEGKLKLRIFFYHDETLPVAKNKNENNNMKT